MYRVIPGIHYGISLYTTNSRAFESVRGSESEGKGWGGLSLKLMELGWFKCIQICGVFGLLNIVNKRSNL